MKKDGRCLVEKDAEVLLECWSGAGRDWLKMSVGATSCWATRFMDSVLKRFGAGGLGVGVSSVKGAYEVLW